MSAEEKILQGILDDANAQAEKIKQDAKAAEEAILAEAGEKAKDYAAKTVSAALLRAKSIKQNAESAAELTVRDAKLQKRHAEIEKTLSLATEKIALFSDEKYFELLTSLAVKNNRREKGELLLSKADLARNTAVFEKLLQGAGVNVTLKTTPADISGGFILKYGDIEYNLSIDAIISDKREILEDRINAILFAE